MKLYVWRIVTHCTLFMVLCMAILFAPETLLVGQWKAGALTVISIVALFNGICEYAFVRLTKSQEKSSLFKIMVIRTVKFLCYLLLTLPLIGNIFALPNENKVYYGLFIVALFFLYLFVEFTYFVRITKQK